MQAYSQSGPTSTVASIGDLDGYTLPPFGSYTAADNDNDDQFGFDPPAGRSLYPKMDPSYSPHQQADSMLLGGWPDFERDGDQKQMQQSYEIDKLISQNLPNATNSIARYGQVTPPCTNSADSTTTTLESGPNSPKSLPVLGRKKRTSKGQPKEEPDTLVAGFPARKRKASRKAAVLSTPEEEQYDGPGDTKRKASLEKNRLAAAKCRVNKKEKTEQLQRDSHDKAVHNAFLKDQIMHMKEQIQQMNGLLLAHANCKGCKSPEEIQKHLSQISADFLANQMNPSSYNDYRSMSMDDMRPMGQPQMMSESYFSALESEHGTSMLNPPLPDFDRSVEFDAHTPMATD